MLPVVEDRLREGLTRGGGTEFTVEAEGLHNGEVGLDGEDGGTRTLLFADDLSTTLVEDGVDTTNGVLGTLDFDLKKRVQVRTRLGKEAKLKCDIPR